MPFRTKLPPNASFAQRVFYPPVRTLFHFFFSYLPYHPIKRVNKPNLTGPYLWASSHSNYLCDTIPAGYEGPAPTKFLAKNTLFKFPIKGFLEFCGALPVARAEDYKGDPNANRSVQNRSTFKVAISRLQEGWPVAIFPEGMSIVSPGIVLPLKPGIAKMGFAAEEATEFKMNLRIIPVGLEYGSRTKVGSGLTIRYGNPIYFSKFKDLYLADRDKAVQAVMEELSRELVHNYPHFKDEKTQAIGKKLVALGLFRNRYDVSQLFLRKDGDGAFWAGLEQRLKAFDEASKGHGIPLAAWGHRRVWKELGPIRRRWRGIYLLFGLPFALYDLVNNTIPELCLSSLVNYLSVDETERMSIRFIISPIVLGITYALQFWFLKKMVFERFTDGFGLFHYFLYALTSFCIWYFSVHWRRQFKRVASLFFFWKAGVDGRSDAVAHYKSLRKYLSEF